MAEIEVFEVPSASFSNTCEVVPEAIVPRIFVLPDLGTDGADLVAHAQAGAPTHRHLKLSKFRVAFDPPRKHFEMHLQ